MQLARVDCTWTEFACYVFVLLTSSILRLSPHVLMYGNDMRKRQDGGEVHVSCSLKSIFSSWSLEFRFGRLLEKTCWSISGEVSQERATKEHCWAERVVFYSIKPFLAPKYRGVSRRRPQAGTTSALAAGRRLRPPLHLPHAAG